jgi:hypothetical protein
MIGGTSYQVSMVSQIWNYLATYDEEGIDLVFRDTGEGFIKVVSWENNHLITSAYGKLTYVNQTIYV